MCVALRELGASAERTAAALCFFALAPLALGSVILYRYDLWPAFLTVAGLAAVLARRRAARVRRDRARDRGEGVPGGRRPAGARLRLADARAARGAALPRRGVWRSWPWSSSRSSRSRRTGSGESIARQTTRPLQIESLGSALLLAAHHAGGLGLTLDSSHGSQNLVGSLPRAFGAASSVLLALALVGIWVAAARGPATPDRLVRWSAASVAAFVALGKVLSPQFLIWLLPLVPLVARPPRPRGLGATRARAAADAGLVPDPLLRPGRLRARSRPGCCSRATSCWSRCCVVLTAPARESPRS